MGSSRLEHHLVVTRAMLISEPVVEREQEPSKAEQHEPDNSGGWNPKRMVRDRLDGTRDFRRSSVLALGTGHPAVNAWS